MLNVIMLSVVMLNVVVPQVWLALCHTINLQYQLPLLKALYERLEALKL
jgi:hypothetical protein